MEKTCPSCGEVGKPVEPITVTSLVRPGVVQDLTGTEGFRFCRSPECEVVYFRAERDPVTTDQLTVPVFQKSTDPGRLVCYCFDHRVSDIEAQVAQTGDSTVPADIAEKCRQGLDRCEETNPQGSCCLGNARSVAADAQRRSEKEPPVESKSRDNSQRAGLLSAGGALVTAVLSSACCWLPLAAVAAGGSVAGSARFFAAYRPAFLVGTLALLGGGFYLVYIRKPRCAPGEACATPSPRVLRMNKIVLWIATLLVVASALFPNYLPLLDGS